MGTDNEDSAEPLWQPQDVPGSQGLSYAEGKPERTGVGVPLTERKDN